MPWRKGKDEKKIRWWYTLICSLRSMWELKDFQQWRQRKGVSPVWLIRWCFSPIGTWICFYFRDGFLF